MTCVAPIGQSAPGNGGDEIGAGVPRRGGALGSVGVVPAQSCKYALPQRVKNVGFATPFEDAGAGAEGASSTEEDSVELEWSAAFSMATEAGFVPSTEEAIIVL